MGTTADKLNKLLETKAAIKQAIIDKGVDVEEDVVFADYPSKIAAIESGSGEGGGSGETYENPDFYEIRTKGGTDYSYLFAYTEQEQMSNLSGFDTSNVIDMSYIFYYCSSLTSLDVSNWNTSNVTDMNSMFYNCKNLTTLDLSNFDTSNVTNMYNMFAYCKLLTSIDLSSFDTSNVTNMQSMFYYCSNLTSLDVSNFDTSNVTNMSGMFAYCSNLTTLDLSNFDTSNVTNMSNMFQDCNNLTSITGELDASDLTNGFYYSSYASPFKNCTSLETLYLKNIYKNVTGMTNASKWSINLGDTKVKDECLLYIINELPDLFNDKGIPITGSIILTLPTTNTLTYEQVQVAVDKGWIVANTTY